MNKKRGLRDGQLPVLDKKPLDGERGFLFFLLENDGVPDFKI